MTSLRSTSSSRAAATAPTDESSNPYFVHHSDGPGLTLVSQPLTGDNYVSWSRSMLLALSIKNKSGFINGSIPKPDESDEDLFLAWTRANDVVVAWILNCLSREISTSVFYAKTAALMWIELKTRFQKRNAPRIFQLRRDIANLRQDQLSVSSYFTRLKGLWEELSHFRPSCTCERCTCGGFRDLSKYFDLEYTMAFLMGLNESFTSARGQLLLSSPLPPVNEVFSLILQEEEQRAIGASSPPVVAPMAFAAKPELSTKGSRKDRPFCTHCQLHGHTVDRCYKLHGYPPGYKPRPKASPPASNTVILTPFVADPSSSVGNMFQQLTIPQCNQLMSMLSQCMTATAVPVSPVSTSPSGTCLSVHLHLSLSSAPMWIIDSGASRHFCTQSTSFIALRAVSGFTVLLPDRNTVHIGFIGDVQLTPTLLLKDVLYVPSFRFNLISVSALTKHGALTVHFSHDSFPDSGGSQQEDDWQG